MYITCLIVIHNRRRRATNIEAVTMIHEPTTHNSRSDDKELKKVNLLPFLG